MSAVTSEVTQPRKLRLWWLWWVAGFVMLAATINEELQPEKNVWDVAKVFASDKLMHFTGYFLLSVWFGGVVRRSRYLLAGVLLIAFGGALELTQGLMHEGRTADWFDFLANSLGIIVGLSACAFGLGNWMIWFERLLRVRKE